MNIEILVSEEISYISDLHGVILSPKYISFRCCEQQIANFHKSVITTPKVCTTFCIWDSFDKALKMLHLRLSQPKIFCTPTVIGSINDRIFLLTNR